jgi:hypothetical protein
VSLDPDEALCLTRIFQEINSQLTQFCEDVSPQILSISDPRS